MTTRLSSFLLAAMAVVLLSGCGWFDDDEERLPGERIPVLREESVISPDYDVASLSVRIPRPVNNPDWPQAGGAPHHAMQHLVAPAAPQQAWRADLGTGTDDEAPLLTPPIVAGGKVFTMDASARVSAFSAADGKRLWRIRLSREVDEEAVVSGGLAYSEGRVFATAGYHLVFALDAEKGDLVWKHALPSPVRSPPTLEEGRVYVVTIDNRGFALSASDGSRLWDHAGISEIAGLLGGAAPAAGDGVVIFPYSSGEVYAVRGANGRPAWTDNLSTMHQVDQLASLADIRARPVLDRDLVLAMSHSGRMVAIDLRSGRRRWEQEIGGIQSPWIAGNFIYVITGGHELVCLTRTFGRVRWVARLRGFEDMEERQDPITWYGPVLAGDRLLLAGSHGFVGMLSPFDGSFLGSFRLPGPAAAAPVVAGGTLYFVTRDGELVAYR